jgi:CheY-like chemotaxis protein
MSEPSAVNPGLNGAPRPAVQPAAQACGVLVVDDQAGIRELLALSLRRDRFAVWVAAGGREALDVYREHRDAIDVVLLDVNMPAFDGPQTLRALQQLDPHVRCCFMSGDLGGYTEGGLLGLGAAAVLRKPFRLADVARTLRASIGPNRDDP